MHLVIYMDLSFHIGMRKLKSLLAVIFVFIIWQLIRLPLPSLEVHPVFAYMYAILEMRDNPEETKSLGRLRIKCTIIGLVVGLLFLTFSIYLGINDHTEFPFILLEFLILLIACFVSLSISEFFNCKSFCGIAAIITAICIVSIHGTNPYLYAIMRTFQTLIGVGLATFVNFFIANPNKNQPPKTE